MTCLAFELATPVLRSRWLALCGPERSRHAVLDAVIVHGFHFGRTGAGTCNQGERLMAALTQDQIEHLNGLMDERWTREFAEIRSLLAREGELRQQGLLGEREADRSDEALLQSLTEINDVLIEQNVEDVRDIAAARRRIAAGTYGECTDCGGEIGYQRLLVYPTAKRCIDCQREHEARRSPGGARKA